MVILSQKKLFANQLERLLMGCFRMYPVIWVTLVMARAIYLRYIFEAEYLYIWGIIAGVRTLILLIT